MTAGRQGRFTRLLTESGFAPVVLGTLREGGALMPLGGALSGKHFLFQG
ncbi:hypothetical protein ACF07Q_06770 [Nocardiopsis dassonvillei]